MSNKLKKFEKTRLIKSFDKDLQERDFFSEYSVFFWLSLLLSFVFQVASGVSSFSFFEGIIAHVMPTTAGVSIGFYIVILLLFLVEIVKYFLYRVFLRQFFALQRKTNVGILIALLLVSVFSAYASIVGGGHLGINQNKVIEVEDDFDGKISSIKNRIEVIENSDAHKQVIWLGNGKTQQTLTPTARQVIEDLTKELTSLRSAKNVSMQKVEDKNSTQSTQFSIFFGIIELLFVVCTVYVYHYKRQSVLDFTVTDSPEQLSVPDSVSSFFSELSRSVQEAVQKVHTPADLQTKFLNSVNSSNLSSPIGFKKDVQSSENSTDLVRTSTDSVQNTVQKDINDADSVRTSTDSVRTGADSVQNDFTITEDFNELEFEKVLSVVQDLDKRSKLLKFPYTVWAILNNVSWAELNKTGNSWKECKRTSYHTLKQIITELNLKTKNGN